MRTKGPQITEPMSARVEFKFSTGGNTRRSRGLRGSKWDNRGMNTDPAGTDDPLSEAQIQELRLEIDRLDAEILDAIVRRSEISKRIGRTRMQSGGTKLVHTRELKVYERFSSLGQEGQTLAGMLLRLGRGRLG
ncbi:hypothetical protein GCM10009570_21010 [Dietzia natronolimnaea]